MKRPQIRSDARKVGHPNGATPAFAHLKLFRKTVPPVLLFWYQVKFMVRFGPQISGTGRKFKIISLVMVGVRLGGALRAGTTVAGGCA